MSIDESGFPKGKIEQTLFLEKSGVQEVKDEPIEIHVTKELKAAARDFVYSWGHTHSERLAEFQINSVKLKFEDAQAATGFLHKLKSVADLAIGHFSSDVLLPGVSESDTLIIRWELFRPDLFSEQISDLAKTEFPTISIKPETLKLAESCVEAYGIRFVRFGLCVDEGCDLCVVERLEGALVDSRNKLVAFLKQLLKYLPTENEHLVVINGDGNFVVDDGPMIFQGAPLRAVLALALLRDKKEFKVEEFASKYNGETSTIARTHFDNGFKQLLGKLSKITRKASESNREVGGIKFLVLTTDAAIEKRLLKLHKKP